MVYYIYALSPLTCLIINIVCQISIQRLIKNFWLLKSVIVGFGIGLGAQFLIELYFLHTVSLSISDSICSIVVSFLVYASLGYCYFHFVNMGETARRIRILSELSEAENGLSLEELLDRYNAQEILSKRIGRLINNGQIVLKNNRYYIGKPVMLWISRLILHLKSIVLRKKSEFGDI